MSDTGWLTPASITNGGGNTCQTDWSVISTARVIDDTYTFSSNATGITNCLTGKVRWYGVTTSGTIYGHLTGISISVAQCGIYGSSGGPGSGQIVEENIYSYIDGVGVSGDNASLGRTLAEYLLASEPTTLPLSETNDVGAGMSMNISDLVNNSADVGVEYQARLYDNTSGTGYLHYLDGAKLKFHYDTGSMLAAM